MVTYRFATTADWPMLATLPFGQHGLPPPEHCIVLLAEEDEKVVGIWAAMTAVHLEGLWVDPAHRRMTFVAAHLLAHMKDELVARQLFHCFTIVQTPEVKALALKAGFAELEGELLHWDLTKESA